MGSLVAKTKEGPDGISSNIGSTVSIMSGHVFLWHSSDAFVQVTGDFDGNLRISLSYSRFCLVVRAGVLKFDIFPP